MKVLIKYLFGVLIIVLCFELEAQDQLISAQSSGKSLDTVLEEISSANEDVKFAYDSDLFKTIHTEFNFTNISLQNFLVHLDKEYFIKYRFIEGTWVLVYNKPKNLSENISEESKKITRETITVKGFVKDKNTGESLLYCNLVYDEGKGCMTNELGYFYFELPETDSVRILISHLGYQRLDTLISTTKTVEILLSPSDFMIDAIEVRQYEKHILQASPQPEKIGFNPLKATNTPRMSNDDLTNALLFIPGVDFFEGGSPGLSIRGGDPGDNLVLFDGIPVLETSHLLGNLSLLNSKFVQQAFVSRGGFDAEFGERVAGLIEITGKSGKNSNPFFELSANLLNTNALISLPVGDNFSVSAAWRRSFIDQWQNYLYLRLVDNNTGNNLESSVNPILKYQDINTKINFHPSDKMDFNLNFLYGDDRQSRDFTLLQTDDFYRNEWAESKNVGASLNWNWQITPNWFSSFSAAFSRLSKELEDETGELKEVIEIIENPGKGKGKGKGLLKTKEKTYTRLVYDVDNGTNNIEEYRVNWKTEFNRGIFRNQGGIGWQANTFNYRFYAERSNAEIPIDSIVDDITNYYVSTFLQQHVKPAKLFGFRWGLRANIDLYTGRFYWQPRGSLELFPMKHWCVYFSSGIYHQFLSNIKRIDSEGNYSNVWFLPYNDGKGVVKAEHYILGTNFDKNGWFINIEGFHKNATGKNTLFAEFSEEESENTIKYSPKTSSQQTRGVDFFIQKKHGIFNHMLAYSLSKSEEKIEGIHSNNWFPAYNDRLHRLKITEIVSWENWNFTGSWNFSTGLPIVNIMQVNGTENFERSPFFSQLDFSLNRKFRTKHVISTAGLSMLNVLNRNNIIEVDYLRFSSESGSLTVRSDVSILSFTPVFFINFKFH